MLFWKIDKRSQIDERFGHLREQVIKWDFEQHPCMIELKPFRYKRSLDQNSLYWMWLGEMATHFTQGTRVFTTDDMHDLMRHRFLGYTDERKVGNTVIPSQLKTTTKLNVGDMHRYLEQIDAWACERGVLLTYPDHSAYAEMKESQNA